MTHPSERTDKIATPISIAICCIYTVGILSGYYFAHGPYTYTNPDTYIHGLITLLLSVYLGRVWVWRNDRKQRLKEAAHNPHKA